MRIFFIAATSPGDIASNRICKAEWRTPQHRRQDILDSEAMSRQLSSGSIMAITFSDLFPTCRQYMATFGDVQAIFRQITFGSIIAMTLSDLFLTCRQHMATFDNVKAINFWQHNSNDFGRIVSIMQAIHGNIWRCSGD